jgi:phage protein D
MSIGKLSLSTFNFYAPRFEIEIENSKLPPDLSKVIMEVSVFEKIDEGASFTITVYDQFEVKDRKFKWLDHPLFEVGNKVKIKMGYGSSLKTLLMGEFTGMKPSFFTGEPPKITLKGQDLSYDYMKRKSPEQTFLKMAYSDIVQKIAKDAGLSAKVTKTPKYEQPVRKDAGKSYFDFIQQLAEEVGFQFRIDGQTLHFVKPEDDKKEILTLELGKDLISFSPDLNTAGSYAEVEVRGHNPRDPGKPIVGTAKAGSERSQESGRQTASQIAQKRHGNPKKVITDVIVNSVSHANSIAQAWLNKLSDGLIEGDAACIGIPIIRTGVCIKLDKMGERFSGKYYVKETNHSIGENGYQTRFKAKRNSI